MGVAVDGGRGDGVAVLVQLAATAINDGSAIGVGAERLVAVGVGQRVVRAGQSELAIAGPAAVDEHILILDFADGRCLEEAEVALVVHRRHHVLHHLRSGLHRGHRGGVELGSIAVLESPVAIDAAIIVDEHGGVELQHAVGGIGVFLAPVAHLEGSVGTARLGHEAVAPAMLVVGIEVVGLGAVGRGHQRHVGGVEHVGQPVGIELLALGIAVYAEDDAIVAPAVQAVYAGRPHHLVASTVVVNQDVVGAVDVDAVLPRLVGVFEDVGLAVGDVLPHRQVGVAHRGEL